MTWHVMTGDCREVLATLPERSVHTVVTSPPYFGLRDYGTGGWKGGDPDCDHAQAPTRTVGNAPSGKSTLTTNGGRGPQPGDKYAADQRREVATDCPCGARRVDRQIGLEPTPDEFVEALVAVFREVRRVLRDDGTVWLNLGDSYSSAPPGTKRPGASESSGLNGAQTSERYRQTLDAGTGTKRDTSRLPGIKPKDLIGVPWMVAFALRADGWYLRSDIIWAKPNPMPESVTDRPTRSHEYIFLLSKSARYFYDADAIRESVSAASTFGRERERVEEMDDDWRPSSVDKRQAARLGNGSVGDPSGRNKRDVWTVSTKPYAGAHFATFPPDLIEPCVLAGAPERACSTCGAPWRREVERIDQGYDGSRYGERAVDATGGAIGGGTARSTLGSSNGKLTGHRVTRGFEPSCACNADPAPGVVLDLFAGAGTTGLVAIRNKRSFIGVELNPEYAQMARDRIDADVRLGHRPAVRERAPLAGQVGLFDEERAS